MIIAIRKELNGLLYIDKEIYSRTETLKLTLDDYKKFKQQNPNLKYTYVESKEQIEREKTFFNEETKKYEIKKTIEMVDYIYVTKRLFTDEQLSQPPYNYTKIQIDDKYLDCISSDFNEDLTFSVDKYNARKQKELYKLELAELQPELDKLTEDLIQAQAGAIIPNLEERKARFQVIHNRIREIQGKEPREYI